MIFKGDRRIGFISLAAFLIAQLISSSALEAQTQKLRIAHSSRSNTTAPFYVAVTKGLFKEEGLEVELIQVNPRLGAMAVINGDVSFTTSFVSTFRGILQGLPLKLVMVGQRKGVYFLLARPEIKDVQDLKGKTLGVSTMRGTDHLVTEELLRTKGLDPSSLRAVALGDTAVRAQSLAAGVVQAVTVSPPHDLTLQKMGFQVLAGPPEVGLPASGLFTSDRLIKENPQVVRRTLRALIKANRFIAENRDQTIGVLLQWIPQSQEIAARSYDLELKATVKDGQMSDPELDSLIDRLGDKKKPLDEVRDFSHIRQALKELAL